MRQLRLDEATAPASRVASREMRLLCPAKINLHLRVGPRRADGFHSLLSWMVTVGLFDTLTFEAPAGAGLERAEMDQGEAPAESSGRRGAAEPGGLPEGGSPRQPGGVANGPRAADGSIPSGPVRAGTPAATAVQLTCDRPDLPCDGRNLVVRVADGLLADWLAHDEAAHRPGGDWFGEGLAGRMPVRAAGARDQPVPPTPLAGAGSSVPVLPVRAVLQKRIPVGAGLGGGSSDAARALLGLNRLWGCGRTAGELSALAARFGSDLSFFLFGPSSACAGRGESVRPIARPAPRWALLVLPAVHMPTADVYRRFDAMGLGRDADIEAAPDWRAWSRLDARELLGRLVNDLEPAAFSLREDLGALRAAVEAELGRVVRMSGSGSSLFTLFDEREEAVRAVERVAGMVGGGSVEVVEVAPRVGDDLG